MSALRLLRRDERGESLTGLLVSMVLLVVVLSATLMTFENVEAGHRDANVRLDAQDTARRAVDRLARDLRNLASPSPEQPKAVDVAGPHDLVFKTIAPESPGEGENVMNAMRVRYCHDVGDPSGALVTQVQHWTTATAPAVPPTASCPAAGWDETRTLAAHLVNGDSPIFAVDSTTLTDVTSIHVDLRVDDDPGDGVAPTTISSGVFLRNQNRRPEAAFTATATGQGILLNGSSSFDPEGQPLRYEWYDGGVLVGTGITYSYAAPAGTRTLTLRVLDPADLEDTADPQSVIA